MKGVVYSEDWTPPTAHFTKKDISMLANYDVDNVSAEMQSQMSRRILSVDEMPYTWAEKVGMTVIHPYRLMPRQYYIPTTDFKQYDYDDKSPEEQVLKARWMAKMVEWDSRFPIAGLMIGGLPSTFMPIGIRWIYVICLGFSCAFWSSAHTYAMAMGERQDLDDFILAKEIYYIKNVERHMMDCDYPADAAELEREQNRFGFSKEKGTLYQSPYSEEEVVSGEGLDKKTYVAVRGPDGDLVQQKPAAAFMKEAPIFANKRDGSSKFEDVRESKKENW